MTYRLRAAVVAALLLSLVVAAAPSSAQEHPAPAAPAAAAPSPTPAPAAPHSAPVVRVTDEMRAHQRLVDTLVHVEFVAFQINAGEQAVLGKSIVGNERLAGLQNGPDPASLLVVTAEQEENLGLEGVAFTVAVKVGEERVFFEDLEQ